MFSSKSCPVYCEIEACSKAIVITDRIFNLTNIYDCVAKGLFCNFVSSDFSIKMKKEKKNDWVGASLNLDLIYFWPLKVVKKKYSQEKEVQIIVRNVSNKNW